MGVGGRAHASARLRFGSTGVILEVESPDSFMLRPLRIVLVLLLILGAVHASTLAKLSQYDPPQAPSRLTATAAKLSKFRVEHLNVEAPAAPVEPIDAPVVEVVHPAPPAAAEPIPYAGILGPRELYLRPPPR